MARGVELTGNAAYTTGNPPPGSKYAFMVTGHVEGTQGSGKRIGGRDCTFRFARQ